MKKIICLLMVFLIVGQLDEIKTQNVKYGDYIEQYAIVKQVLQSGNVFYNKCSSCNATLTVKNSNGNILILNQPMTELTTGHFGYIAKASELNTGVLYTTFFNITSNNVSLGSDTIDGKLSILSQSVNTNTIPSDTSSWVINDVSSYDFNTEPYKDASVCDSLISGWLDTPLMNFIDFIYCKWSSYIVYPFYNLLVDMKIIQLIKIFIYIYLKIWNFFKYLFSIVLAFLGFTLDFYNNPSVYFFGTIIPFLITIFSGVFIAFFLFIMFIEAGIIGYAYLKNSDKGAIGLLTEWGNGNFNVIYLFVGIIYMALMGFVDIITAIFIAIGSLNPLGK